MNNVIPIIIPSYEPDERLIGLLRDLREAELSPVILVDDGSGKEYAHFFELAKEEFGAAVLRHETNMGKGNALKTAFSYCLKSYKDMTGCITADSDGQHSAAAIKSIRARLEAAPAALVLGVRNFELEGVPAKSQFGNNLTRKVFRTLYKQDISDTQTGLRGIPASFMETLLVVPGDRFEFETRMLIRAVEDRVAIVETPIETIYDSKENHATHFRPVVDSIRIYRVFGFAFGRFLLSSLSSSAIDLALFQLFCVLFCSGKWPVSYIAVSTVAARIISAVYNYSVNYFYVFKSKEKHSAAAWKYFALAVVQMACSAALTTGLVGLTGVGVELLIKIPVDTVLFLISYQIQKRMVYS